MNTSSDRPHPHGTADDALLELDQRLLQLLTERMEICRQRQLDNPGVVLPQIESLRELAEEVGPVSHVSPKRLMEWLMHGDNLCVHGTRPCQQIAFLGPIYSYSYLAAVKFFGLGADFVPVATISGAFAEVAGGHAGLGVVPIENSTDGRVVDTLGMFAKMPVEICGEVLLPIHHFLLGRCARTEIHEVHSKPQALSQCRRWLAEHLPEARLVEVSSTATAAATAATEPGVAAIASREAGVHHGLRVIEANVEDQKDNVTRFAIIGNRPSPPTGRDKTSLMFQLEHRPGALADAMVTFQMAEVNLTWIESFPLPNCPNEYLFFVELEGHRDTPAIAQVLEKLKQQTLRLELLGSYARGVVVS
ncbi:prephenate dehydratase [Aureliella helgolandensis]|uniref:prephenate dehydratase n=1 Tax=Aureliella helgolandensis TaxID=2527968 RepID=A0A518GDC4_9BACT|nr:prephenate dehydratase [Aureliella helgolandensis]QDV26596.1 Prephenate dehydratase [Aureliella helgolandensis]